MTTKQLPEFLFQLCVEEFKALFKELFHDEIAHAVKTAMDESFESNHKNKNDSIRINEASEITGLSTQTIYSKVSRGEMPALSRGKPLMFSKKKIEKWLKEGKPSVVDMMHEEWKLKHNK